MHATLFRRPTPRCSGAPGTAPRPEVDDLRHGLAAPAPRAARCPGNLDRAGFRAAHARTTQLSAPTKMNRAAAAPDADARQGLARQLRSGMHPAHATSRVRPDPAGGCAKKTNRLSAARSGHACSGRHEHPDLAPAGRLAPSPARWRDAAARAAAPGRAFRPRHHHAEPRAAGRDSAQMPPPIATGSWPPCPRAPISRR